MKDKLLKVMSKGSTMAIVGLIVGPSLMGLSVDIGVETVDGLGAGVLMASLCGGIYLLIKAMINDM